MLNGRRGIVILKLESLLLRNVDLDETSKITIVFYSNCNYKILTTPAKMSSIRSLSVRHSYAGRAIDCLEVHGLAADHRSRIGGSQHVLYGVATLNIPGFDREPFVITLSNVPTVTFCNYDYVNQNLPPIHGPTADSNLTFKSELNTDGSSSYNLTYYFLFGVSGAKESIPASQVVKFKSNFLSLVMVDDALTSQEKFTVQQLAGGI